ncbi:EcsC family protein [Clostridium uliginosum]|uniref:EcsC protein family protein n=1 Tax=Clostridium uliginosum TaxID=119641 RepID=A0A1I1RX30_9CLOT|nr:EcsC family protein [Clostridium uliginosum]SFD35210.1 EcsC protein family protein [Clostridium uliginosum]
MRDKASKNKKIIEKQVKILMKQENKILNKKENTYINNKIAPIYKKIEERIPDKIIIMFQKAFEKGFYGVFEKGTMIIEKSYNSENLRNEYDINQYILSKDISNKNFKKIDKQVQKSNLINKSISTAEGAFLGILGIGMPDIPVFIGMILKTIYEICLHYGFEYKSEEEKIFILNIINTVVTKGKEKAKYSEETDKIGYNIDTCNGNKIDFNEMIKLTSENLSQSMIGSKVIQGIAIIGAYGGIDNYKLIRDVSKIASIKYKKRFLKKYKDKY